MGGEARQAAGGEGAAPLPGVSSRSPAALPDPRWRWSAGLGVLFVVVLLAAELHARSSRVAYVPPPEFRQPGRWGMVADAAAAFRVWRAAGVSGRRLVVLSGRWSRPQSSSSPPAPVAAGTPEAGKDAPELIDANSALYAAGQLGIVRRFSIAMPPSAYEVRYAEASPQAEFSPEPGGRAFDLPYHGLARRFAVPERLDASDEPSLVLVEPSFFQPGAPSPARLLDRQGVAYDLALVALEDPASDEVQRAAALAFGEGTGAYWLETEE